MFHQRQFRQLRRRLRSARVASIAALLFLAHPTRAQHAGSTEPRLTLRALLDSVRIGHPGMRAADSRARAAAGSRLAARAFGNPILGFQVDQTPFPGGKSVPGLNREAISTATFPLEFLYQRGSRITRANAVAHAAEEDARAARQRLALDAAAAYYRTGLAQIQSATTHDLLDWLDTLVVYNRSRVKEGAAAESDLIRAELERDRVASESSMQDAALALAQSALGAFASSARLNVAALTVVIEEMPLPLSTSAIAPRDTSAASTNALSRAGFSIDARPDIRAARERLAASVAAVASERSMLVRQLGATIGTMQSAGSTSMIAGVSLPLPLFDQNRGETQRASAERDAVAFELAAQERSATTELSGALNAARVLTERASRLTRRDSTSVLARAEESRRIALGAYREGAVPLFQVLDAARAWAESRMTYYRLIATQQQSVLSLLAAQGLDLFTVVPAPLALGELPR